jgi:hypothetical protein
MLANRIKKNDAKSRRSVVTHDGQDKSWPYMDPVQLVQCSSAAWSESATAHIATWTPGCPARTMR